MDVFMIYIEAVDRWNDLELEWIKLRRRIADPELHTDADFFRAIAESKILAEKMNEAKGEAYVDVCRHRREHLPDLEDLTPDEFLAMCSVWGKSNQLLRI